MKTEAEITALLNNYKRANRLTTKDQHFDHNESVACVVGEALLSWVLEVQTTDIFAGDPIPNPVEGDAKNLQSYLDSL